MIAKPGVISVPVNCGVRVDVFVLSRIHIRIHAYIRYGDDMSWKITGICQFDSQIKCFHFFVLPYNFFQKFEWNFSSVGIENF